MNKNIIADEITASALEHFKENLFAVLLYGSSISARKVPNDLDIIIILKNRETPKDISFFRDGLKHYSIVIDLQIINSQDLNPDFFSHDGHGQFFISFLKSTKVLYGINPFLKIFPKYSVVLSSAVQKAQYYYFRSKKIHANVSDYDERSGLAFHRKKILLMLADFWLAYSGQAKVIEEKNEIMTIVKTLTGKFPTNKQLLFLTGSVVQFKWSDIFSIYYKYYFSILDTLQLKVNKESIFIGNIYAENFYIGSSKLAIIASGCPSDYNEKEMVSFLNIRGYDVVNFHYTSTGKSKGTHFSPPESDIAKVVNHFNKTYEMITIIANSYGGYGALNLDDVTLSRVNSVITVSPVIDFGQVKNIGTLSKYLEESMPGWYRFSFEDFSDYIKNSRLVKPKDPSKLKILHGTKDEQISSESIIDYSTKFKIYCQIIETDHLSLNKVTRQHIDIFAKLL